MPEAKVPTGLRAEGRRFWLQTIEDFQPTGDEAILLEAACRSIDELVGLEKALRSAPVLVEGSRGQERPNPLFHEVRQHRLTLAKLLGALGIEEEAGHGVKRSSEASKLALVRWHGKGQAS